MKNCNVVQSNSPLERRKIAKIVAYVTRSPALLHLLSVWGYQLNSYNLEYLNAGSFSIKFRHGQQLRNILLIVAILAEFDTWRRIGTSGMPLKKRKIRITLRLVGSTNFHSYLLLLVNILKDNFWTQFF